MRVYTIPNPVHELEVNDGNDAGRLRHDHRGGALSAEQQPPASPRAHRAPTQLPPEHASAGTGIWASGAGVGAMPAAVIAPSSQQGGGGVSGGGRCGDVHDDEVFHAASANEHAAAHPRPHGLGSSGDASGVYNPDSYRLGGAAEELKDGDDVFLLGDSTL